jgi:exonuclease SbcC
MIRNQGAASCARIGTKMIPLKLTVRNFMCYRDNVPPLDLEGIHVACLCGDNGHGKSALLDAMTWALWGRGRTRTPELVHQGRTDMAVELEFLVREQRYRVIRRYSRSQRRSQGTPLLELQILSESGVQPITGNTISETEARIRDLLHMDYDTFINTAFLLQGRADEFTRSTPAQRKECLAEVLDLSYYQRWEEQARERSRNASGRLREIEGAVEQLRGQLDQRPASEERLAALEATLERVRPEADTQRSWVESLRDGVEALRSRRGELESLEQRLKASRGEIDDFARQVEEYQTRIRRLESVQERRAEIMERSARIEQVKAEAARLDQATFRANALDLESVRLQGSIAVERERLTGQLARLETAISNDLEPRVKRLPELETTLQADRAAQASMREPETALDGLREEAQALAARVHFLEESSARLVAEMEETRKKFDMLGQGQAACPLCKQPLGKDGQEHLVLEYRTQGEQAKLTYRQYAGEAERTRQAHAGKLSLVSRQQSDLERRNRELQSKIATHERDLDDSKKAEAVLSESASRLDGLKSVIENGDFASDERRRLAEVQREAEAVGYDAQLHGRLREELGALEPYADLGRRLAEAAEALPREHNSLVRVMAMRDRRRGELAEDQQRRDELAAELKSLPALESQLSEAQTRLSSLDRQLQQALIDHGVARGEVQRLDGLEQELGARERERQELQDAKGIYDELAVAFGRNGIQALIIEMAIPQLQDDANELLGRLSDGRMTLKLQLREGRKERLTGTPSEELDIRIGDEVGTRAYETFSGGEAFRINFALRIALSRLLAQRSGAPLPILFIDEGFGSQDLAGQERLKEAIQLIKSDFRKIIVITHLEEIKDSFPTRIEVTKTDGGSTFTLV